MIRVTKHCIEQYKKRIALSNNLDNKVCSKIIREILKDARYVSDNSNGVLLRNEELRVEIIVKHKNVLTIYPIEKR